MKHSLIYDMNKSIFKTAVYLNIKYLRDAFLVEPTLFSGTVSNSRLYSTECMNAPPMVYCGGGGGGV